MNPNPSDRPNLVTFTYSGDRPPIITAGVIGYAPRPVSPPEPARPPTPAFTFVHDREKGVYRLTGPDGRVEVWRDQPVRQLVVAPDPQTGEMKPVMKGGQPVYRYLCREEREVR